MPIPKFCKDYYEYWDAFVNEWKIFINESGGLIHSHFYSDLDKKRYSNLTKWAYPIFGRKEKKKVFYDSSIYYLPEPWWGNDGTQPLSAVVVNLNPGSGGFEQTISNLPSFEKYSDFIREMVDAYKSNANSIALKATNDWHYKNRCIPIFRILKLFGITDYLEFNNFLSIELVPWHSSKFVNLGKYPNENIETIINQSVYFAAEASKEIRNDILRNKVLFRMSINTIRSIFSKTKFKIKEQKSKNKPDEFENANYVEFEILCNKNKIFTDVRFYAIWQPFQMSMNNFPYSADLKRIIEKTLTN